MKTIVQIDRSIIKGKTTITDEGFLICDAVVTRSGVFDYMVDGKIHKRYRPPEEVFNQSSMDSLKLKPVVHRHPPKSALTPDQLIKPDSASSLQRGSVGETIRRHGNDLMAKFTVTDQKTIDRIKSGEKDISLGYKCDIVFEPGTTPDGQAYDSYQKNIVYNHLATLPAGRAGNAQIVLDMADAIEIIKDDQNIDKINNGVKKNMKTVIHNGVSYEVADEFVPVFQDLSAKSGELGTKQAQIDAAEVTKKDLEKQIEDLKSSQLDESEIEVRAKERSEVLLVASTHLDEKSFDGVSVEDIKKEVCAKVFPEIELDGKDAGYISGLFDVAKTKEVQTDKKDVKKKSTVKTAPQIDNKDVQVDARQAMIDRYNKKGDK